MALDLTAAREKATERGSLMGGVEVQLDQCTSVDGLIVRGRHPMKTAYRSITVMRCEPDFVGRLERAIDEVIEDVRSAPEIT